MGFGLVAAKSSYVDFKDKIIVMAKKLNSCDEGRSETTMWRFGPYSIHIHLDI